MTPKARATSTKPPTKKPVASQKAVVSTDDAARAKKLALYNECDRVLGGHGKRSASGFLAQIPGDTELDIYGSGGVVSDLEREVAELLGTESSLFLVSGTMAQQAVLRIHADRRNRRSVVFHPACHLDLYEERAYERLHDLVAITVGAPFEPMSLEGLEAVKEPYGTLLIELPQREYGGTLPSWDELVQMTELARSRGAAVHLDGARLWEAGPFYAETAGKSLKEIVALFDTAYVSFYKGLGGISGCCVVGDEATIDELKMWRARHGGRLFGLWPYAASAQSVLHQRKDNFVTYYQRAKSIARQIQPINGIEVLPYPIQSSMMHICIRGSLKVIERQILDVARREHVWMFGGAFASDGPTLQRFELNVGDATMAFNVKEIRALFEQIVVKQR